MLNIHHKNMDNPKSNNDAGPTYLIITEIMC